MSNRDDEFFNRFFAPMFDHNTKECKCLECLQKGSSEGGGRWVASSQLWVCDDCLPAYDARLEAEQKEIDEVVARIKSGEGSNEDLEFVVRKGLAYKTYGDPDSNRPTGVVFYE